ncbi:unnamed protein product [Notodromas monacha]|uniref:t-SNARE coiled-coil homology domain-containing protein n=1 Tax=Notodromas monacha TaxID=399045 RepID=A0A7R9GH75_9CRUS|nr:unnamed protein product [Notodromas monacha]CAG0921180.1 unnamed protein product [Notodromas monacha]
MSRGGFGSQNYPTYGAVGDEAEPSVGFRSGSGTSRSRSGAPQVSPEFHGLSEDITSNIFIITNGITTLERAKRSLGTLKDTQGLRDQIHLTQMSTNQVINQTTKDLVRLASLVQRGEKMQKIKMEKLGKEFKASVEKYTTLQKEIASALRRTLQSVTLADDEMTSDDRALLMEKKRDQILAQKKVIAEEEFDRDMLLERETRVKQIESDMLDLNQIMRELSAMVVDQGEVIDTVESNVERAYDNVERGASQLLQASTYQSKYRKKICGLCSVLALIAIIIIVIIVINESSK